MIRQIGFTIFIIFLSVVVTFSQGVDAGVTTGKKETSSKPVKKTTPAPSKPTTTKPTVSKPPTTTVKTNKSKPSTAKKTGKKTDTDVSPELSVFVNQSGVKISIDDVEYDTETGESPFIFDSLIPSNHTIRVEKEGFQTQNKSIFLSSKQKLALNIDLVAAVGFLDISTNPLDLSELN